LKSLETIYLASKDNVLTTVQDKVEMDKQLAKLDNDYARGKAQIEADAQAELRKQREQYKAILKAEATAEGALAIMKTFGEYGFTPWAIAAAALQAVETATQIGVIDAQQFAGGVRNFGGGLAIVGEQGPELVGLPSGSNVYSNRETMGMMGGDIHIYLDGAYIMSKDNARELAEVVGEAIFEKVKNNRYV